MKKQESPQLIRLHARIDEILFYNWDPLNLQYRAPRNKYSAFVSGVVSLAMDGAGTEAIADALASIEKNKMGYDPDMSHCRAVAQKIITEYNKIIAGS